MPYLDPAQQREFQRRWVARRRAAWFSDKSCVKCGSTDDLELDHIDPKQKVAHSIWSWKWERIHAEVAKCQVLCHDCHLEKTLTVDYPRHPCGTPASARRGCKCEPCVEAERKYNREKMRELRAKWRAEKSAA